MSALISLAVFLGRCPACQSWDTYAWSSHKSGCKSCNHSF